MSKYLSRLFLFILSGTGIVSFAVVVLFFISSQDPNQSNGLSTSAQLFQSTDKVNAKPTHTPDSPLPTPTTSLEPTPTHDPTSTPPPIVWDPLPACVNEPWSTGQWHQYLHDEGQDPANKKRLTSLLVRQIRPMSIALKDISFDTLVELLATNENDPNQSKVLRSMVGSLWLNIAGGRLHRATELSLANMPTVKTVGALIIQAEQELLQAQASPGLQGAIHQVMAGRGIAKPVCTQLLVARLDKQLEQHIWAGDKLEKQPVSWPREIKSPKLFLYRMSASPDAHQIAIESFGYESGGPIFLYDPITKNLSNLISQLGETIKPINQETISGFEESSFWEVLGWHPDSQHLLIGAEGASIVLWIDLQNGTYQTISLGDSSEVSASAEYVNLASDGAGFVYVQRNSNKTDMGQSLIFYNLLNGQSNTLITLAPGADPINMGRIHYPRISPMGDRIAYLVETGHPIEGVKDAINLYDLPAQTSVTLIEGDLGRTEPVWSPDGQTLAFARKQPEHLPNQLAFPIEESWRGNIWIISLPSGELKQVTFIDGGARGPLWSSDSRTIAFWTHDAQIGLAPLDQPHVIWQVTEPATWPLFATTVFLP